jgi:hypothetical protein
MLDLYSGSKYYVSVTIVSEFSMPPVSTEPTSGARKRLPPAAPPARTRVILLLDGALHRRMRLSCASRGISVAAAVREVLERAEWPILVDEAA